jgi:MFS family permease
LLWVHSGAVLAIADLIVAREPPRVVATPDCAKAEEGTRVRLRTILKEPLARRAAVWSYAGNGFQTFVWAALAAWLPSYLNRYYAIPPDEAGVKSGAFILISGVGMVACGYVADRLGARAKADKMRVSIGYALLTGGFLFTSFSLPPGTAQLVLLGAGMFVAVGTIGPSVAVITDVTDSSIHATVIATFVLFSNLLGQAPGPFITGILADRFGLDLALQMAPLSCVFAAAAFAWGSRFYDGDVDRLATSAARRNGPKSAVE